MAKKKAIRNYKVKRLLSGEILKFRDSKGRLTKPDARKKLIAEVWKKENGKWKKTPKSFNKVLKNKAVPQKFSKRAIQVWSFRNEYNKKAPKHDTNYTSITVKLSARLPIMDGIELKCGKMLDFIHNRTKKNKVTRVTWVGNINGVNFVKVFMFRHKPKDVCYELGASIANAFYSQKMRMSSLKDTPRKENKYLSSITVKFSWAGVEL